jgi:hypothetical protein
MGLRRTRQQVRDNFHDWNQGFPLPDRRKTWQRRHGSRLQGAGQELGRFVARAVVVCALDGFTGCGKVLTKGTGLAVPHRNVTDDGFSR